MGVPYSSMYRFIDACELAKFVEIKRMAAGNKYRFLLVIMEPIHAKKAIETMRKTPDKTTKKELIPTQVIATRTIIDEKNRLSTIEDYIVENVKTVEQLKRYAVDLLLSEIGLNKMISIIESKQKAGKLTNKQAHDLRKLINAKINRYKKSDIKNNRALYVFGLKIWEIK